MGRTYSITFGQVPEQYISREPMIEEIVKNLNTEGESKSYKILGVRGSGKSVTMEMIKRRMMEDKNWIVFELSIQMDLVESFVRNLQYHLEQSKKITKLLPGAVNISLYGIGAEFSKTKTDDSLILLRKLMDDVQKTNKHALILIDEVANSETMREFASIYSILVKEGYPVAIVMAGLYENIYELQEDKSSTFIARATACPLEPLNAQNICNNYMENLNIDFDSAIKMTKLSMGYALGYQALGRLIAKQEKSEITESTLKKYDVDLAQYSYDHIWKRLTNNEREFLTAISEFGMVATTKEVLEYMGATSNFVNQYRIKLSDKGLLDTSIRGKMGFTLPRFSEYVQFRKKLEEI